MHLSTETLTIIFDDEEVPWASFSVISLPWWLIIIYDCTVEHGGVGGAISRVKRSSYLPNGETVCVCVLSFTPVRVWDGGGYNDYLTSLQTELLLLPGRSPTPGSALAGSQWPSHWSSATGSMCMAWCPRTSAGRIDPASVIHQQCRAGFINIWFQMSTTKHVCLLEAIN